MERALYLTLCILLFNLIIILSLIPLTMISFLKASHFTVLHFFSYFILAATMSGLFNSYSVRIPQLPAFLISTGLGIFLETIQLFIPFRHFSFFDMIANTLGAGIVLITIKQKIDPRKHQKKTG